MTQETGNTQFTRNPTFFVAGGTLGLDSPSYVVRAADDALFNAALAGRFCYVLTARQMGKSSLMVRTAQRLTLEGVRTAIIDLTKIGTIGTTVDQWYLGFLSTIKDQLKLHLDVVKWWEDRQALSPVQRFTNFLRDIVLTGKKVKPVAIFIDEIDSTLSLNYSDDFFAAIRAMYNARATEPIFDQLTFVLLGVASPTDLMKDSRRTPFNVGQRIDLPPFKRKNSQNLEKLQQGLEDVYPGQGQRVFERIFYWTSGHPYLTQRLCLTIVERQQVKKSRWTHREIDAEVERLFLSLKEKPDINISVIIDKIRSHKQKEALLNLYLTVYDEGQIADDEHSQIHEQLKLVGLVRAENGNLVIYNKIYREIFDRNWIKRYVPNVLKTISITTTSDAEKQLISSTETDILSKRPLPPPYETTTKVTRTQPGFIILLAIVAVAAVIGLLIFLWPSRDGSNGEGGQTRIPTSTFAAVVVNTASPSATAVSPTQTPTAIPTNMMTPLPSGTPTQTPPPTLIDTPTSTIEPTPENQIMAAQNASIFIEPNANSTEFGIISANSSATVLGRSEDNIWFYIETENEGNVIEGFASVSRFDWSGDINSLPIIQPKFALVIADISIFEGPSVSTALVVTATPGDIFEVHGRSTNNSWLYVAYDKDAETFVGFAIANRLDYGGDISILDEKP
ncbi:MAG: AAA-like domain-containing protein [Anaerolineales bacterium]|nr:AAA-like domain-containing protein [Anaerolineales bacterium]